MRDWKNLVGIFLIAVALFMKERFGEMRKNLGG